jgi:hypothetical protein
MKEVEDRIRRHLAEVHAHPAVHICYPIMVEMYMAGFADAIRIACKDAAPELSTVLSDMSDLSRSIISEFTFNNNAFVGFVDRADSASSARSAELFVAYFELLKARSDSPGHKDTTTAKS